MSGKRKASGTQAPRCLLCHIRPATAKDLCTVCEGRMRRDKEAALALGIRLEAFGLETAAPRPAIDTGLLSLDDVEAMFARGVNYQVLYQSATAIVESVMDPATGLEVNRMNSTDAEGNTKTLAVTGDTWPDPPLKAALLAGVEAT